MCELNVNDLKFVAGGSSRESQLSVNVVLDEPYHEDYTVRAYLDGELQRDKTQTLDCSVKYFTLRFSGSGRHDLKVKINHELFRSYVLDFDAGIVC